MKTAQRKMATLWTTMTWYACFDCRIASKQEFVTNLGTGVCRRTTDRGWKTVHGSVRCPECGGPAADCGKYSKVPARGNVRGWKQARQLFVTGKFIRHASPVTWRAHLRDYHGNIRR